MIGLHRAFAALIFGTVAVAAPDPLLLAESGEVGNESVELENSSPGMDLSSILLVNGTGNVRIRNVVIRLSGGGGEAEGPKPVKLKEGQAYRLYVKGMKTFRLDSVKFYVAGGTSNVELRGVAP